MHRTSVLYNHRKRVLLSNFNYTPKFKIIGLDFGGNVDTIAYNCGLIFPDQIMVKYNSLYKECSDAYRKKDDKLIADCVTKSLKINLELSNDILRQSAIQTYKKFEALGVINAHSGTCIGFIYPMNFDSSKLRSLARKIRNLYNLSVFVTQAIS